ncbi:MAG: HAD hydrolase-like protein [Burkholderiales bacterium]|nr:HAD hydrolase-like protein [Burkholderiales bacterium]
MQVDWSRHSGRRLLTAFRQEPARIFRAAAQAAGVAESEVLHIGDDPQLDGHGALASGMQMAWVNRAGTPWPDDVAGQPHAEVGELAALCAWLQV